MTRSVPSRPGAELAGPVTYTRYRVVGLAVLLAMVTYLDRVCISKLAPDIMRDLSLSKIQMGYVFSSFALAYAIFEIPTAWWADRSGTRIVLTRIVLWWSAFTMVTAMVYNYAALLAVRFLFGAGEAGAWPCVARTFSRWIPRRERGRVQGFFFAGAHLAGGVTPLLIMALQPFLSWRAIFVCFGAVGLLWAFAWHRYFRDDPSQHASVGARELHHIVSDRPDDVGHVAGWAYWGRLLRNRDVLALCVMYAANGAIFYFCITWLPTYLHERHGFDATSLGIFSGLPLLVSVPSDLFGGAATDALVARFGLRIGRSVLGAAAYCVAGVALLFAASAATPVMAAVLIALATAACMFTLGAAWSTCMEIGRNHVAVVGATMNTAGQISSLLCPLVVAYSVEWYGSWDLPLYLMGVFFLVGAGCWLMIDPARPVFDIAADEHLSL